MGATGTVGKKELSAHLGWSRPTLDKRLKTDPKFPVVTRGDQSGGWAFRPADVDAYLAGGKIDIVQLRDTVAAPLPELPAKPKRASAHHQGEATARQRKDGAQADLLEDKLARERGELVETESVRQVLATMLARLGKGLDSLPETIVRVLDLPDTSTALLRPLMDDVRTQMVRDCESHLTPQSAS